MQPSPRPTFGRRASPAVELADPAGGGLVTAGLLVAERSLPLVVRPRLGDVQLVEWGAMSHGWIDAMLLRHGAVLFRGFSVDSAAAFHDVVRAVAGELLEYDEPTTPRTRVSDTGFIYTSTDYPPDESIAPHNERSYSLSVPRRLHLWCDVAPVRGGATPIGDVRRVLARLSPAVRSAFARKGWMYVRHFHPGLGLPWPTVFQTTDKAAVEAACARSGIDCEWRPDDVLVTRQVRAAIEPHPVTGELVWFNHAAFFHVSSMPAALRGRIASDVGAGAEPNQTCYGDGSPIEDEVVREIREAYAGEMVRFDWEHGDVLVLDNMLSFHARDPFGGPRRILVAMTDPHTRAAACRRDV